MICKKCGIDKAESEFARYKNSNSRTYTRCSCKSCLLISSKKWRDNNREHVRLRSKRYRDNRSPEQIAKVKARKREEWFANHEENLKKLKERSYKNKDKYSVANKKWAIKNKDKIRTDGKKYREENRDTIREKKRIALRKYRSTSPKKRLKDNISCYIYQAIRGTKNYRKWQTLTGYTLEELMSHLESQFKDGMTWDNYGKWHIDHIRPIASFNFTKPEDEGFVQCWSLSNLQPLWAKDNLSKGSKWVA